MYSQTQAGFLQFQRSLKIVHRVYEMCLLILLICTYFAYIPYNFFILIHIAAGVIILMSGGSYLQLGYADTGTTNPAGTHFKRFCFYNYYGEVYTLHVGVFITENNLSGSVLRFKF